MPVPRSGVVDGAAPGPAGGTRAAGLIGALRDTGARARTSGRYLGQAMRMMVGVPDYDAYLLHFGRAHPGDKPMTHNEFLRNRMDARYGRGKGGCC